MKKNTKLFIFCLIAQTFLSCASTKSTKNEKKEETPRRTFESVDTTGLKLSDMFISDNGFIGDGKNYSKQTVNLSTALFVYDLGIANDISKDDFSKIGELFFNNMPLEDEVKMIVIPNLSKKTENDSAEAEKDGYFFITQSKNKLGETCYKIESNIPINSIWAKTYDGYEIAINSNFFKNKVPARWVAIMNIAVKNDTIVYNGVAYPVKAAPLQFTGTGIGPDRNLSNLTKEGVTITSVKTSLEETVIKGTQNEPENEAQKNSMDCLKKYSNYSLALYSYLEGDNTSTKTYFENGKSIVVELPENSIGGQCKRLSSLVEFLLKMN